MAQTENMNTVKMQDKHEGKESLTCAQQLEQTWSEQMS